MRLISTKYVPKMLDTAVRNVEVQLTFLKVEFVVDCGENNIRLKL